MPQVDIVHALPNSLLPCLLPTLRCICLSDVSKINHVSVPPQHEYTYIRFLFCFNLYEDVKQFVCFFKFSHLKVSAFLFQPCHTYKSTGDLCGIFTHHQTVQLPSSSFSSALGKYKYTALHIVDRFIAAVSRVYLFLNNFSYFFQQKGQGNLQSM